ncbi:MAG: EamA family transporter [Phycisphaerales bacterium]|nr:EamA family transporter [Phycisphaerales bacterium]
MNAIIFAVIAGLCWGAGEVCAKAVLHTHKIGPFLAVALRTSVALPLIWVAYLIAKKLAPEGAGRGLATGDNAMTAKEWLLLLGGSGVIAGAFAMIAFYISISMGEVSKMKPIAFSIAPAAAVLLGAVFIHEPLSPRKVVAILIILAGVILLSTGAPVSKS